MDRLCIEFVVHVILTMRGLTNFIVFNFDSIYEHVILGVILLDRIIYVFVMA